MSTYAIDYDGTWTSDPEAFRAFASLLRRRGHRVLLVTGRVAGHGEVRRECEPHADAVIFSGPGYKRHACTKAGETVDIWIDDMPGMIGPDIPIVDVGATLAEDIAEVDARMQTAWEPTDPEKLLAHARSELTEIEQAMDDDRVHHGSRGREVVIECGDGMLLLARVALMYGAKTGLEPLAMAVTKTLTRLEHFERLVKSVTPADAWRMAKVMARRG